MSDQARRGLARLLPPKRGAAQGHSVATIDVARAAPLSPLAPVDITDRTQVTGVLEIAARIGEVLVSAGTTTSDAAAQVKAVTESFGLWYVHVDMTHNLIRLFAKAGGDPRNPVVVVRVIAPAMQNFHALMVVDRLIRDIQTGAAGPDEAIARLDALSAKKEPFGIRRVVFAWGLMGGSVAILLGGTWVAAVLAMIAGWMVVGFAALLGKVGLPVFFQNIVGGLTASMIAAAAYHGGLELGITLRPSFVIAACIITLLAGLTLVQAIQNMVTSAPVSGTARFFDTILSTSGIVAGVGIGISLSSTLGLPLPPMETAPMPNFASASIRILGSIGATMAFARACFANWKAISISGLTAAFGSTLFYTAFVPMGLSDVTAIGATTTMIGLFGGLLARRYAIPPLVIAIAGVTPLLPGLAVYRGMYGLLHDQVLVGFENLTVAIVSATALSAGVVFGEWIARRIRMPQTISSGQFVRRFKRLQPKVSPFGAGDGT